MTIARASGKATLFVANQNSVDALPENAINALADETDALVESNKALAAEIKAASAGATSPHEPIHEHSEKANPPPPAAELAKMRLAPTDAELAAHIVQAESKVRASPFPRSPPHFALRNLQKTDREAPRPPRAAPSRYAARLARRAGHAGRELDTMARRMGPQTEGVLQVRVPPTPTSFSAEMIDISRADGILLS